jgi:hypothetical protein
VELLDRGARDGVESLKGAERLQFLMMQKQHLYQTNHYHYENGVIDDDLWQSWVLQMDDGIRESPAFARSFVPRLKYLGVCRRSGAKARH